MVIPTIRIVVSDDDCSVFPVRLLLQKVEHGGNERLLINRIGITWVRILEGWCLQETHRREIARFYRGKKVIHAILMIRRFCRGRTRNGRISDGRNAAWSGMGRIGRRGIKLEPVMMLDIIRHGLHAGWRWRGCARTACSAVRVRH